MLVLLTTVVATTVLVSVTVTPFSLSVLVLLITTVVPSKLIVLEYVVLKVLYTVLVEIGGVVVDFKVKVADLRIVTVEVGSTTVDFEVLRDVRVVNTVGVARTKVDVRKVLLVVRTLIVTPGAVRVLVLTVEYTIEVCVAVIPLIEVVLIEVP
jgi:hypothetical protein